MCVQQPEFHISHPKSHISLVDFLGIKYPACSANQLAILELAVETAAVPLVASGPSHLVNFEQYGILVAIHINGTDLLNVA